MTDPISLSGLGLGIASLTAQALIGCLQAMELIVKARNLKPEFQYLNIRLQLEKQRLWNWSEVSGLLAYLEGQDDALDSSLTGLNRHLILEVLLQIQALVTKFVKVKGRYEEFVVDRVENLAFSRKPNSERALTRPPENESVEDSDFIKLFPGSADTVKKFLRSLEITQQLPKRLRWAMWDQEKFRGLLDRLKELNDCLIDLVDNSVRMQILSMTKETNINFLGLCNKVDDLGQLIQALARYNEPPSVPQLDSRLRAVPSISYTRYQEAADKEILDLSRFKTLLQSMDVGGTGGDLLRFAELNPGEIQIQEPKPTHLMSLEGFRCEAVYRNQSVWIEWKEYQPLNYSSTKPDPRILSRVQKLAALLRSDPKPAAFRVPHCLGYFDAMGQHNSSQKQITDGADKKMATGDEEEDNFRFGFVFAKPEGTSRSTAPVALFDLLQGPSKPSLTERVALAKAIANCVYYLHSVNWLHKGLRSHNIVFFPDETNRVDYAMPYLSGFDYARPSRKEEMTEAPPGNPEYDIYRHPDIHPAARSEGYKKSYDIYSVGIILTEIALWQPMADIVDPRKTRKIVLPRIRARLLTESVFMEAVSIGAGSLFAVSARCCLEGGNALGIGADENEEDDTLGAEVNKKFYERVVKRLEQIRC